MAYAVTFYSYKGGVGRTLALANVAVALWKRGHSVFLWEMDLEAPGLLNIPLFQNMRDRAKGGTANLIVSPPTDWNAAVSKYTVTAPEWQNRLRILPAGPVTDYAKLFQQIHWDQWFGEGNTAGPILFQQIRKAIEAQSPDFLLIDSRTGLTDLGAVCTVQLPNLVVLVYQLSHQNLAGAREVQSILTRLGRKGEVRQESLEILRLASMVPLSESPSLLQSRRQDAAQGPRKKLTAEFNLEPHFEIPFNASLLLEETVFVDQYPDHPITKEFERLALDLENRLPVAAPVRPDRYLPDHRKDDRFQRGKLFEEEVAELLRLLGYEVKVNILREGSQVDVEAIFRQGPLFQQHFIVECKDHQKASPIDDVRNLFSRVHASPQKGALGLLITRNGFTAEAKTHAESLGVIRTATYDELLRNLVDLADYHRTLIQDYEGKDIERLYVEPEILEEHPNDGVEDPERLWPLLDEWLAADNQPFLAVLGDYGTGKTWLSRRLAYRLARRHREDARARQPLLVELKEVAKAFNLDTILTYHFQQRNVRVDARAVLYALNKGQFLLILDGFDEMAIQLDWASTVANLRELLRAAGGKAKVLLTCRTEFFKDRSTEREAFEGKTELYREIFGVKGTRVVYLRDFTDAQVDDYLSRACGEKADAVRTVIRSMPSLHEISGRPVMLDMIVTGAPQLAKLGGDVTVGKLYQAYTEKWLEKDEPKLRLTRDGRRALVQELAYQLWQSGDPKLHHSRLSGVLRNYLRQKLQTETEFELADQEVRTASFLTRDAEGNYSFSHRSFMEFFLAERIAEAGVDLNLRPLSEAVIGFLIDLCGRKKLIEVVDRILTTEYTAGVSENALRIASRLGHWPKRMQLAGADLSGFVRHEAQFQEADLRGANLSEADFSGSQFVGARLEGAVLTEARLERSNLSRARFDGAKMRGARLDDATVSQAVFNGADLRFASMIAVALETAVVAGAHLDACALRPRGRLTPVVQGISARVSSVAYSPDGSWLATGSADGVVRLYDTATFQCRRRLEGHALGVTSVAYSPDGESLATGSYDNTVRLWKVGSGRTLRTLEGHAGFVNSVAYSPDGESLATGSSDNTVRLWEVASGRTLRTLEGHAGFVRSVAYSPDGESLATGSDDKTVRLWEVGSGRTLRTLEGHAGFVRSVAYSPDGESLATGSDDKTVRLWEVGSGRTLRTLEGHAGFVNSVAYSPDGESLATGSDDKTVRLWEVGSGRTLRTLEGHAGFVNSVAYSSDGESLATGSSDNTVRLWEVASGRTLRTLEGHEDWVRSVAYSPDGESLATGSYDNTVRLWEVGSGRTLRTLEGHEEGVTSVAYSPDGESLATGSSDKTVRLWEVGSGRTLRTLEGHEGGVTSVAYSPDGESLATGSDDNTVRLWEVGSGRTLRTLEGHAGGVTSVAYSPDGESLATGSDDKTVRLWEVASGRTLRTLEGHEGGVRSVAYSSDGESLATGSSDRTVRLWEVGSGRTLRTLEGHAGFVRSVAYSPDGESLATGSSDNTVRLWEVASGRTLRTLEGHADWVMSVAYSPDGKILASGASDATIRLWHVPTGECLAILSHLPNGAWAALTPDNHFHASPDALPYLTFIDEDLALFPAAKLPHLNSPEAVQKSIARAKLPPPSPRPRKRRK